MGWGRDAWLTDREGRHRWMRCLALMGLAEQIVRTPATADEALVCLLDEIFRGAHLPGATSRAHRVAEDVRVAGAWVESGMDRARRARAPFRSLGFLLTDAAPYELHLALIDKGMGDDVEWANAVTWRSNQPFQSALLCEIEPLIRAAGPAVQADADYILPLTYSACLVRDVLGGRRPLVHPMNTAIISHAGGDSLLVAV